MSFRIGIAGLGRIGRGVLRANFSRPADKRFDISVVCDVMPIDHIAYLLAHDSTYGHPPFTVDCEGEDLILDGYRLRYQRVDRRRSHPEEDSLACLRPYALDVLFDATGTASNDDFRALIKQKIAKKILCTWNVSGGDISIVHGVNHQDYSAERHEVISASTCTGNALTPVCHILDKHLGIDYARVITIHPELSDQRVLDGYHASSQLGRSCAASIVPTATNVARSTELVLPSLAGNIDALSYRVPTAIVSVIDFTATLSRNTSRKEVIELLTEYANGSLADIIHCEYDAWGHQKASIDYLGSSYSAILLMNHLTLSKGRHLGVSLMHDNEYGYCCRVLDVLGVIANNV